MLSFLITIVKLLLIICAVATVHEFGHFFVSKLFKVQVNEFAIGFGPKNISKKVWRYNVLIKMYTTWRILRY